MNNLIKIISFLFLMIVSNNLKAETYEENVQIYVHGNERFVIEHPVMGVVMRDA